MEPAFDPARRLDADLRAAAASLGWEDSFSPDVRPADARFGDFQANGVLPFAKARGTNPRQLATALENAWRTSAGPAAAAWSVSVAGPGFINFRLEAAGLLAWADRFSSPEALRSGGSDRLSGQVVVVDFSSPNTAKQMHVGHLRSAVIGEALCRLLEFSGATVIRDNHLGDWGTQFGILLRAYRRHVRPDAFEADPLVELERLYQLGQEETKSDPAALEEARADLVRLQQGEPASLALWRRFTEVSRIAFDAIYARLGIRFDHYLGESFYNDRLDPVFSELLTHGIAEESAGALVVFNDDVPRFSRHAERPFPFIIRKEDGAANYGSSDLATMLYRTEHFHANGIVIVTDDRQSDHFQQLWLTTRRWYAATGRRLPWFEHVTFGKVCGPDGRPLRTRDGGTIKLRDLLDEAEERALALVTAKDEQRPLADRFDESTRRTIATVVGIGSVQYADLCQNRSSDYVFAWEKMISLEGNTAAYMLYAVARIHSIFRNAGLTPGSGIAGATPPSTATEIALARRLLRFPDAVQAASVTLRPHLLCTFLYELAGDFSAFYTADKVLVPGQADVQARRLLLCASTLAILETGLGLLGLRTLQRM